MFILFLNGATVLERSEQSIIVSLSASEAECIASCELVKETINAVHFLLFLGIH